MWGVWMAVSSTRITHGLTVPADVRATRTARRTSRGTRWYWDGTAAIRLAQHLAVALQANCAAQASRLLGGGGGRRRRAPRPGR